MVAIPGIFEANTTASRMHGCLQLRFHQSNSMIPRLLTLGKSVTTSADCAVIRGVVWLLVLTKFLLFVKLTLCRGNLGSNFALLVELVAAHLSRKASFLRKHRHRLLLHGTKLGCCCLSRGNIIFFLLRCSRLDFLFFVAIDIDIVSFVVLAGL